MCARCAVALRRTARVLSPCRGRLSPGHSALFPPSLKRECVAADSCWVKRFLVLVILLCFAAAGVYYLLWQRAEERAAESVRWTRFVLDSLGTSVKLPPPPDGAAPDSVYWQWIATGAELQSRRWQQAVRHSTTNRSVLLDDVDVMQLKKAGLGDPVHQLRDSLMAHPEVIPTTGMRGGAMRIWHGEHIVLLPSPYVFARFDDGQVRGSMLLEYSIVPGGGMTWKRLWSDLERPEENEPPDP
jgi:hypothetical protein